MTTSTALSQFGVIGLGTMGRNLALNIESRGVSVACWNLEPELQTSFLEENEGKAFTGAPNLEALAALLERPRKLLVMITAGKPVDYVMADLEKVLEPGDILIDGGNSLFEDTRRREAAWREKGLRFFGMGVSGGEEGARFGPSLMPGGEKEAYAELKPILESIAATSDSGPCVTHVGSDGAGHFVKMVHNGIEYADMQLIAEVYDLLKRGFGFDADRLAATFAEWNKGPLESFLIEITAQIFRVRDEDGEPLVEKVLDRAGQKGTGRWTLMAAIERGISIPTIAAAVDARVVSSAKDARVAASEAFSGPKLAALGADDAAVKVIHDGLQAAKILAYAQGLQLIAAASEEFDWGVDLREVARIWKAGCIIRARMLDPIMRAYEKDPKLSNLVLAPDFQRDLEAKSPALRRTLALAQTCGVAAPALSASLAWFDGIRTANLPQNLTQAQRDAFGAHTYLRKDRPGVQHTDWLA